jgi:putative tryptophan/tyrosine transport system substrate-binding protein
MGEKWLELLLEIAPGLKRAAAMFHPDPGTASYYTTAGFHPTGTASYYIPSFEAAARSLGVEPITAPIAVPKSKRP